LSFYAKHLSILKKKESIDATQLLVEQCKLGHSGAQFALYERYAQAMYATALRITKYQEEAEDVLQEAFLEAFSKMHTFRGDSTFGAWLKTIVVNKAISVLRNKRIIFVAFDGKEEALETEDDLNFENTEEMIEKIKRALLNLPDGFRLVLQLYLFEGYDHQEIGGLLGIGESTSRSQYLRGKNKLIRLLKS
jgi:RNA polymerase sigma factor (sigma-70 family)